MTISRSSPGAANWRRMSPYRAAMSRASLVADDAEPPTLTRPRTSVPSVVKKRRGSFLVVGGDVASGGAGPGRAGSESRGGGPGGEGGRRVWAAGGAAPGAAAPA